MSTYKYDISLSSYRAMQSGRHHCSVRNNDVFRCTANSRATKRCSLY
jgi:hypothetical protein